MSYVVGVVFLVWGCWILPSGALRWYEAFALAGLWLLAAIAESVHEIAKRGRPAKSPRSRYLRRKNSLSNPAGLAGEADLRRAGGLPPEAAARRSNDGPTK